MFRRFTTSDLSGQSQVKSSVARGIRNNVLEQLESLECVIDDLIPKKTPIVIAKLPGHAQIVVIDRIPLFFQERGGPWAPTLRLLHQYPDMLPHMRVDKGAIKFIFSGANIMCPGLTHPNASMAEVEVGQVVAIMAEGKEHALGVGVMVMSTQEIRDVNKGIAITLLHYLDDGLWNTPAFE